MTADKLVRPSALLTMACRDALEIVGRDGSVRRLEGDTAALAEVVLAFCETPREPSEIRAHIEALTGAPIERGGVVDALLALLRETGALGTPIARAAPRTHARVVIAMGGAVAAADAPTLVRSLQGMGLEVRVVASERALRFVTRESLEALTHAPVLDSMWSGGVPHVSLASWADLVVVWPATATMIGRLATGDCSELVSAVAITTRAPVLVAPSMNEAMIDAVPVARNLDRLRADGFRIAAGALAHEVADAPDRRELRRGGAPDATSLAKMIEALCRATIPTTPHDAASWEAFHRRVPEQEQSWTGEEPDTDVMRMLDEHAPTGALWDVGTGHGAIASAAAARGRRVVATDVSETALARASARASDVVWICDDVTASRWSGIVDVVVDRGTLHTLPIEKREAYVSAIAAHTRSGATVIVTTIASEDVRVRVHPMTSDDVTTLFGERFDRIDRLDGVFRGRLSPPPPAVTTVLRRR